MGLLLLSFALFPVLLTPCLAKIEPKRHYKLGNESIPIFNIDLETSPTDRWKEVAQQYSSVIKESFHEILANGVAKFQLSGTVLMQNFTDFAQFLQKQPKLADYFKEIKGLAKWGNLTRAQVIFLTFILDFTMTSSDLNIVDNKVQYWTLRLIHSKVAAYRKLLIQINFLREGAVVFSGFTFAGSIGLIYAQDINKVVAFNRFVTEHALSERMKRVYDLKLPTRTSATDRCIWPVSFLLRHMYEKVSAFPNLPDALNVLSTTQLASPAIITLYGMNESVKITKDDNTFEWITQNLGYIIFRNLTKRKLPFNASLAQLEGSLYFGPISESMYATNSYDYRRYTWNSQYQCANTISNNVWKAMVYGDRFRRVNMNLERKMKGLIRFLTRVSIEDRTILRIIGQPLESYLEAKAIYPAVVHENHTRSMASNRNASCCAWLFLVSLLCRSF